MDYLGVCCIINQLRDQNVFTGRSLIKRTFTIDKASELALQNCNDLLTLLQYCVHHNINVFRVGSDFFPRMTEVKYSVDDLKHSIAIKSALAIAGEYAFKHNINLSCHPGPFTIISSPNDDVNASGIDEIHMHSLIGDLLNVNANNDFTINFHINSSYGGDYTGTASRFINNFNRLSDAVKSKIILENDDRKAGWTTQKLYQIIHPHTNIPICFDIHHWSLNHDNDDLESDFKLAKSTWAANRSMQVHYSQSPTAEKLIAAHSDYYRDPIPSFIPIDNPNIVIHLEAKAKEQALFHYRNNFKGK